MRIRATCDKLISTLRHALSRPNVKMFRLQVFRLQVSRFLRSFPSWAHFRGPRALVLAYAALTRAGRVPPPRRRAPEWESHRLGEKTFALAREHAQAAHPPPTSTPLAEGKSYDTVDEHTRGRPWEVPTPLQKIQTKLSLGRRANLFLSPPNMIFANWRQNKHSLRGTIHGVTRLKRN